MISLTSSSNKLKYQNILFPQLHTNTQLLLQNCWRPQKSYWYHDEHGQSSGPVVQWYWPTLLNKHYLQIFWRTLLNTLVTAQHWSSAGDADQNYFKTLLMIITGTECVIIQLLCSIISHAHLQTIAHIVSHQLTALLCHTAWFQWSWVNDVFSKPLTAHIITCLQLIQNNFSDQTLQITWNCDDSPQNISTLLFHLTHWTEHIGGPILPGPGPGCPDNFAKLQIQSRNSCNLSLCQQCNWLDNCSLMLW